MKMDREEGHAVDDPISQVWDDLTERKRQTEE